MSEGKMRLAAALGVVALLPAKGKAFRGRYRKVRISRFRAKMRRNRKAKRRREKAARAAQLRRGTYRS